MPFDVETLYNLLPAYYRIRDAGQTNADEYGPLKALLGMIAESIAVLEDDLAQLYDNQFIETCAEWVVPYIGDLIGSRRIDNLANADLSAGKKRLLSGRSQVANTLRYRRRKGTLTVIEDLARDVTGWEAKAVEFFQHMIVSQHLNHVRLGCSSADVRRLAIQGIVAPAFDTTMHTGEIRSIDQGEGRYNLPNIGIYVWRLRVLQVTGQLAYTDPTEARCYRFNPLGADLPLFASPQPEAEVSHLAGPENVPLPISRRRLHESLNSQDGSSVLYGPQGSLSLYVDGRIIPSSQVVAADLSNDPATGKWAHHPDQKFAVDPILGRVTVPANLTISKNLQVSYCLAAPSDIGTVLGESILLELDPGTVTIKVPKEHASLTGALLPPVEMRSVEVLLETNRYQPIPSLSVDANHFLALRTKAGTQATMILNSDWFIGGREGSEILLEGLLVSGGRLVIPEKFQRGNELIPNRLKRLHLRRCTFVPGIGLNTDTSPQRPGIAGVIVETAGVTIVVEDCILNGLRIHLDSQVELHNSICDVCDPLAVAYAGLDGQAPGGSLTAENCTFVGRVHACALQNVLNTIFLSQFATGGTWPGVLVDNGPSAPVRAEQRQLGCVQHSFVPWGSRTPRRSGCHPASKSESNSLWPRFTSSRYGTPGYLQLSSTNAAEIWRGSNEGACLGAYHDLFEPQRLANLRTRLDEYCRFGLQAGIFTVP